MKPATRHKMKIAGVEVETFPTTYMGKYVRGVRCWNQSYWRLVMIGEVRIRGDELYRMGEWNPSGLDGYTLPEVAIWLYRRRVGRKP